jgi:hypothetical protein
MAGVLGAAAPFLIGALWGVGDGMMNTELNAVVGLLFEDSKVIYAYGMKMMSRSHLLVYNFFMINVSGVYFDISFISCIFDESLCLAIWQLQEASFAQFKVWECGAVAAIFFLSPHITLQTMLILMIAALFISLGAFLFLTIVVEKSSAVRS